MLLAYVVCVGIVDMLSPLAVCKADLIGTSVTLINAPLGPPVSVGFAEKINVLDGVSLVSLFGFKVSASILLFIVTSLNGPSL